MIYIVLILIIIVVTLLLMYNNAYGKLKNISDKIEKSDRKIKKNLKKKYDLIVEISEEMKSNEKKKNYLKEFDKIDYDSTPIYDLDKELVDTVDLINALLEDNNELKTSSLLDKMEQIKDVDQVIISSKKYFNKNNNSLIKCLKGYYKIVAKIARITTRNSYEIKEPIKD